MFSKSLCAIVLAIPWVSAPAWAIEPAREAASEKRPDPTKAELEAIVQTLSASLDQRIEVAKVSYHNHLRELAEYRAQQEILHEGGPMFAIDVERLRKQSLDLTLALDGKKALYEAMERGVPETLPITPDVQDALAADPKINRLEEELLKADEGVAAALARDGNKKDAPDVLAARAARETIEEQISTESARRLISLQARKIERCRTEFLEAQEQLLRTRERLMTMEQELREEDLKRWNYNHIKEDCDRDKMVYESLLNEKEALTRVPMLIQLASSLKKSAAVHDSGLDIELSLDPENPAQSPRMTIRMSPPTGRR